jgi:hypothetical protein
MKPAAAEQLPLGNLSNWPYPDARVEALGKKFAYKVGNAAIEQIATGMRWAEGPVYFRDGDFLLERTAPDPAPRTAPGLQRPGLCRPPPRRRLPSGREMPRARSARQLAQMRHRQQAVHAFGNPADDPSNGGGAENSRCQVMMSSQSGAGMEGDDE